MAGDIGLWRDLNRRSSTGTRRVGQPGFRMAGFLRLSLRHRPVQPWILSGSSRNLGALRNPVRVHVQTEQQPGAAFIRIRGFSGPRLICQSLSGSIPAPSWWIDANELSTLVSTRTAFPAEQNSHPDFANVRSWKCGRTSEASQAGKPDVHFRRSPVHAGGTILHHHGRPFLNRKRGQIQSLNKAVQLSEARTQQRHLFRSRSLGLQDRSTSQQSAISNQRRGFPRQIRKPSRESE